MDKILKELYLKANKNNITIYSIKLKETKAFATNINKKDYLAISNNFKTEQQEKEIVAHELAHIEKGTMYIAKPQTSLERENIDILEYRTRRYALELLIPLNDLKYCLNTFSSIEEASEYLNVKKEDIQNAYTMYKEKNLL